MSGLEEGWTSLVWLKQHWELSTITENTRAVKMLIAGLVIAVVLVGLILLGVLAALYIRSRRSVGPLTKPPSNVPERTIPLYLVRSLIGDRPDYVCFEETIPDQTFAVSIQLDLPAQDVLPSLSLYSSMVEYSVIQNPQWGYDVQPGSITNSITRFHAWSPEVFRATPALQDLNARGLVYRVDFETHDDVGLRSVIAVRLNSTLPLASGLTFYTTVVRSAPGAVCST